MNGEERLAERFERDRAHLRSVAYRMLGSLSEADDAVQEAWLRLSRADTSDVQNLTGWLTTVVSRVCLDMLRSRRSRREDPLETPSGTRLGDPLTTRNDPIDPEHEALLADSVGLALMVVLDKLNPVERVAFVLHDMFGVPFDDIATIVDRSPNAAKMLASRARRRVHGTAGGGETPEPPAPDLHRRRQIVDAFLAASRGGDFEALLTLLDPDVVLRADPAAVLAGASARVHGAPAVAESFSGRARAARPALVDGSPGLVWTTGGRPRMVFDISIANGRIVAIDILADADHLNQLDLTIVGD